MAISAISSISAGGSANLFRATGIGSVVRGGAIPRVQPIPALERETSRREDASLGGSDPSSGAAQTIGAAAQGAKVLDPRWPASLLDRPGEARPGEAMIAERGLSARQIGDRLGELLGEKAALEGRQARQKSASSQEVLNELTQLKARDGQVRAHEAAHIAAGGRYIAGGASYTYERGPDGGEYAIGGEVGIDTSPVPGNPEETAQKMRIVRAAALAPIDPSAADLSVAAAASETEAAAMAQIAQTRAEELAKSYSSAAGAYGAGRTTADGARAAPRAPLNMLA